MTEYSWIHASAQPGATATLPRVPRKVALIMGNGAYGSGILGVATASADSSLVRNIFRTRFGFQARVLQNASKAEISAILGRLSRELGRNDQLMVYYAGRNQVDRRTGRGYWLPRDAQSTSARNWISNDTIYNLLQRMNLRQELIMSDRQFAVSAQTRTLRVRSTQQGRRSQISVIASGAQMPVCAASGDTHSAYTWRLASTLASVGDATPAPDLFRVIRERLTANARRPLVPGQQVQLDQPHTLLRSSLTCRH